MGNPPKLVEEDKDKEKVLEVDENQDVGNEEVTEGKVVEEKSSWNNSWGEEKTSWGDDDSCKDGK